MIKGSEIATAAFTALAVLACLGMKADAAQCGSTAAGFNAWKRQFAEEARGKGISASSIAALMATNYATATIAADRGQRSFSLSLDQLLAKRGASSIVARGRALQQSQAVLFASIQQRYGVPPGPLLAIWGMETAFGSQRGDQNTLSAVATVAYDCRRPEYFTEQLYAALKLIDRGVLSPNTRGSMHGEIGQTQFLPKNILAYGTGNLDSLPTRLARRRISSRPMAGVPARDTNRAKPISQPSRHGMPLRSISAPSRLLAVRLTEATARPRRADATVVYAPRRSS
jgi:membrane-bound lytic murein transglycosylase B